MRIEPMPRCGCEYHVEQGLGRLPRFEGGGYYLDPRERVEIATSDNGQILTELDAHDAASALRKMTRSLTRTASKFQHCGAAFETAQSEQVFEDLLRVIGTRLIVKLGGLIERPFQLVAS